ncbi:MAG TPA: ribosome biogenesis GTP-binding protein YihA/YsxC [Gammaproteobacteria bacterium]|nr:ribosome biogenesis GTP-binding protein YihA/YsxC [Gammaproteobacteria bacterium]
MAADFRRTRFEKSAASLADLPADTGREVAFAGRSNSGKSSALNAIVGVKGLARVSKTPGRTQLINYFSVSEARYLVDLPGYGYARVPLAVQRQWEMLLGNYFTCRKTLAGLVLVMDVRRPLTEFDTRLLAWTTPLQLPVLALLSKSDKLSSSAALAVQRQVAQRLKDQAQVGVFSAPSKTGVENARQVISEWLLSP